MKVLRARLNQKAMESQSQSPKDSRSLRTSMPKDERDSKRAVSAEAKKEKVKVKEKEKEIGSRGRSSKREPATKLIEKRQMGTKEWQTLKRQKGS